jgi:2-polyprenyl-3-methyl-5-hydroxy-6-metoxy-1,4-benzoquinol methylase
MSEYEEEVSQGKRFEFGANWARFLNLLNDERIRMAEESLKRMLQVEDLKGKSFIDIGSGSGLFSLAAKRLGARVHSFDYDTQSVACTAELKKRYFPDDAGWLVEEGSALKKDYLKSLGKFDIVYSWGVLHHTGAMMQALENIAPLVNDSGCLFIAIYNDQGRSSQAWLRVKMAYNRLPAFLRWLVLYPIFLRLWGPTTVRDILSGKPFDTWRKYAVNSARGMSPWRDVVDWVGGLPFEVAKPEEVFDFYSERGFNLSKLKTCAGGLGCNEFVFRRL